MFDFFLMIVVALILNIPSLIAYMKKKKHWRMILRIDIAIAAVVIINKCLPSSMWAFSDVFSILAVCSMLLWLVMLIWSLVKAERITPRIIGILLLVLGSIVAIYAITLNTVYVTSEGERIRDSRTAEQKTDCLIFSSVVFVIGLAVLLRPQGRREGALPLSAGTATSQPNATDELDKLFALKQKGAITEAEYETRKQQLLK